MPKLHNAIILQGMRLSHLQQTLRLIHSGTIRKEQTEYDNLMKDAKDLERYIDCLKGELSLLGVCPIPNCQIHTRLNFPKVSQQIENYAMQFKTKLANSHLSEDVNPISKKISHLQGDHQMVPPPEKSEPTNSKPEATPIPPGKKDRPRI
ncbi:hypothetical protein TNCV_2805881 [Trichonephila clavipes]|nr:hypothetical protein TNCV_2805881 [Trichonephila clavipes]